MKSFLVAFGRIVNMILDAINVKRKKDAVSDPANTIANGGIVQHSDKTIGDISDKSEGDSNQR